MNLGIGTSYLDLSPLGGFVHPGGKILGTCWKSLIRHLGRSGSPREGRKPRIQGYPVRVAERQGRAGEAPRQCRLISDLLRKSVANVLRFSEDVFIS